MTNTITLSQILAAREHRVQRQQALLARFPLPLVCFTMNIAGPVKNSPLIRRGFSLGQQLLLGQLARAGAAVAYTETVDEPTGCEGFYAVDWDPAALKALCCQIEEQTPLGRLFDLDVLRPDGQKLERPTPRRCLICDRPVSDCARSRAHTVAQLQAHTRQLLQTALDTQDAEDAASMAVRALLYEVSTTPKPGLVDRQNSGSHRDMDFYTFLTSAASLFPYFSACVRIGRQSASEPAPSCFARLRWPGKLAEGRMLTATGGVNTHKGAIFTLGLACAALGRLERAQWADPAAVLAQISAMTAGTVARELEPLHPQTAKTAGEHAYLSHGAAGVRGQAEAGFPTVLRDGLPTLEQGLAEGRGWDAAGAAAMLAMLAHTDDTNMIARGGFAVWQREASALRVLLQNDPYPDRRTLEALDRAYIAQNLSPGGSADLLALCFLLHFLRTA